MKTQITILAAVLSCAFAGQTMALTKEEYKAQDDRISADYKAAREKCNTLKANAKDICVAEAKGAEKVAKAELEAQYKPSPRNDEKVTVAKADAAYDVAKEKCDDLTPSASPGPATSPGAAPGAGAGGNASATSAKDVCMKDAKAAHVKAKEDAKVTKAAADNSQSKAKQ
jgi:hypothetical protein